MMWAYVMISVRPADSLLIVQRSKNFNIDIFSDAINVINVKLCMMVLLIELFEILLSQKPCVIGQKTHVLFIL